MRLRIFKEARARVPRKSLSRLFEMIVKAEAAGGSPGCVNLIFSTDRHLRALNRRFRNRDRSTDVLTFGLGEPAQHDDTLGEIYVSVPTAKRQTGPYGTTLTDELLRLACHGLLHLFGYDHVKAADAERMKAKEDHFLNRLRSR